MMLQALTSLYTVYFLWGALYWGKIGLERFDSKKIWSKLQPTPQEEIEDLEVRMAKAHNRTAEIRQDLKGLYDSRVDMAEMQKIRANQRAANGKSILNDRALRQRQIWGIR